MRSTCRAVARRFQKWFLSNCEGLRPDLIFDPKSRSYWLDREYPHKKRATRKLVFSFVFVLSWCLSRLTSHRRLLLGSVSSEQFANPGAAGTISHGFSFAAL